MKEILTLNRSSRVIYRNVRASHTFYTKLYSHRARVENRLEMSIHNHITDVTDLSRDTSGNDDHLHTLESFIELVSRVPIDLYKRNHISHVISLRFSQH